MSLRSTTLWMARKTGRRSPWGYHFRRNILQWGQGCDQPCWYWVPLSVWQHQCVWQVTAPRFMTSSRWRRRRRTPARWSRRPMISEKSRWWYSGKYFWYYLYWPNDKNWDPKPITKILVQNYFLKSISPSIDARFQHWSDTSWCRPQSRRPPNQMSKK